MSAVQLEQACPSELNPLISTLARVHRARGDEMLRPTGISAGQEQVIRHLAARSPIPQNEITRLLGVEPATAARTLARMEKSGVLHRTRSTQDRRVVMLELTEQGKAICDPVADVCHALEAETRRGISEDDLAIFTRVAQQMTRNLERR
ncbi:MarR family winged helix-turn-helix transcriptional regulator [Microbacterium sp. GXS0129]|uniref:MarR family winged helix-turn-helix transcriptional regulator n=1 Tax=Microbacterium sp. GXS0129 TaxID=3377836 RepID=UPI00383AB4C7